MNNIYLVNIEYGICNDDHPKVVIESTFWSTFNKGLNYIKFKQNQFINDNKEILGDFDKCDIFDEFNNDCIHSSIDCNEYFNCMEPYILLNSAFYASIKLINNDNIDLNY
jgi:hypothetical protein